MEANFEHNPDLEKLSYFFELLTDGVYVINKDYVIEYANASFLQEFGAYGHKKCYEYLCNNPQPCQECRLEKVLAGETIRSEWHCTKTGKIYDTTDAPLIQPDGRILKIKIIHDITDTEEHRRQIRDLSRFPEENPFPVLRIASDGTILYSNTPGEILLDVWDSGVGQKTPDEWCSIISEALGSNSYQVREIFCGEQYFSFAVVPIPEGGYVNLYGRDITVRKQAEEALQQNEQQFRAVFEVASVGIMQVNPADGHFLRCNEKYCQITGYSTQELIQFAFPQLTHPDDRQQDEEIFMQAVQGKTPHYLNEKRYICKDGSVIWVRINAAFVRDSEGHPVQMVAICEDITERRQSEDQLRESYEELRRFNRMTVDRELRMVELKKEINQLCQQSGLPERYPMDPADGTPVPADETFAEEDGKHK